MQVRIDLRVTDMGGPAGRFTLRYRDKHLLHSIAAGYTHLAKAVWLLVQR